MKESKSVNRLTIFKYNAILSILFFLSSTFYLGIQIKNYSFTDYTISQMSYFLSKDQLSIFNLLFFIKCFLDLSFAYYIFKFYNLRLKTLPAAVLLVAILSFGLLGFFFSQSISFDSFNNFYYYFFFLDILSIYFI